MSISNILRGANNSEVTTRDNSSRRLLADVPAGPSIEKQGIQLNSITLVESGTYNPEYLRPYIVSASQNDLNTIADTVAELGGGNIAPGSISGVASSMLSYNASVHARDLVSIENGWDSPRFAFLIEVVEKETDQFEANNREFVTIISGFTDIQDYSTGRFSLTDEIHIAPDTTFYVSNMQRIERETRRIKTNDQLIVPSYHRSGEYRRGENDIYTLRPRDVFTTQSVNAYDSANRRGNATTINSYNRIGGANHRPSRAGNVAPTNYLASSINALLRAETVSNSGNIYGNSDVIDSGERYNVYNQAQSYLHESQSQLANGFIHMLKSKTSFSREQTFSWDELGAIFGRDSIEDITQIHVSGKSRTVDDRSARAGEDAHWNESENGGRNAVIATVLKQTLPAFAFASMIYVARIEATNYLSADMEQDAIHGIYVNVSDVVFAANFDRATGERFIREFEEAIAIQILKDVSLNNAYDFDIVVDLDWRLDSFFSVGVDGGPMIRFSSAGFSNALTSPIITTDQATTDLIGSDLSRIVNSVLGK